MMLFRSQIPARVQIPSLSNACRQGPLAAALRGGEPPGQRLQAYKVTEEGVEHPFRDSVVTNLVKLVDVLPKLNVTGDPELERLASEVRAALLVDPQELRKSESIRSETAKAATAICDRMMVYMAGYSVPAPNEGRAA